MSNIVSVGKYAPIPVKEYREEIGFSARRTDIWGTDSFQEYDAEKFDLKLASQMLRRDATINTCHRIIELVLRAHLGTYQHDDPKIQQFVSESLQAADGWDQALTALRTAPWYGFALVECMWDVRDGRWVITSLKPRHPTTLHKGFRWEDGELTYVEQKRADYKRAKIPLNECLLWSYEDEFGEEPEGRSILEGCYASYHASKAVMRLWHRELEQGPKPLILWPTEGGEMDCPFHNITESKVQVYTEVIERLESTGGFSYETVLGPDGQPVVGKPEVMSTQHIKPGDYSEAMHYHDTKKYAVLLVPRLLLEEAEHGTRAQSEVQFGGLFSLSINSMLDQQGAILVEQGARRLIQLNFAGVTDYGRWAVEKLEPEEWEMWATILRFLLDAGFPITTPDWDKVRGKYPQIFVSAEQAKGQPTTTSERLPRY